MDKIFIGDVLENSLAKTGNIRNIGKIFLESTAGIKKPNYYRSKKIRDFRAV